jgi:hypothetical protein
MLILISIFDPDFSDRIDLNLNPKDVPRQLMKLIIYTGKKMKL